MTKPPEPPSETSGRQEHSVNRQSVSDSSIWGGSTTLVSPRRTPGEASTRALQAPTTTRAKEVARDDYERAKERLILRFVVAVVGAWLSSHSSSSSRPWFPDDIRKWNATLTSILSMAVGYLGGKATK